jgi:hypothetical protein
MAFHFFFGNFLDFLKDHLPQTILRYRYMIPLAFYFLLLFIWLKKKRACSSLPSEYLFAILIIVDAVG